jgi:hypothetical protein
VACEYCQDHRLLKPDCLLCKHRQLIEVYVERTFRMDNEVLYDGRTVHFDFISEEFQIYKNHFKDHPQFRRIYSRAMQNQCRIRDYLIEHGLFLVDSPISRFFVRLRLHGEITNPMLGIVADLGLHDPKNLALYYKNQILFVEHALRHKRTGYRTKYYAAAKQIIDITPYLVDLFSQNDKYKQWCSDYRDACASYVQSQTTLHTRETYQVPKVEAVHDTSLTIAKQITLTSTASEVLTEHLPRLIQGFAGRPNFQSTPD